MPNTDRQKNIMQKQDNGKRYYLLLVEVEMMTKLDWEAALSQHIKENMLGQAVGAVQSWLLSSLRIIN
jgi:hypothetical protein